MPGCQLWVPGPWGPDLGRYAEEIEPELPTEPVKPKGKAKAEPAPAEPATLGESISG